MLPFSLIILCLFPCVYTEYYHRPSYQVLLQRRNRLGALVDGKCYGNVLQSRIVLTAASCLLASNESGRVITTDELAVSFKSQDLSELIYFVGGIDIYPGFNVTTLDNDIAILTLSTQLPLSDIDIDIEWVLLADYDLTTESPLQDKVESTLSENVYPGYGVIYESNLVGIISLARDNVEYQFPSKVTQISPYISWIYAILQNAEIADMQNNNYSVSLPYRQRKSAEMGTENLEPEEENFANPEDLSKEYVDSDTVSDKNVEELVGESEAEYFTVGGDLSKPNGETKAGYYTNAAVLFMDNGISSWILLINLIIVNSHFLVNLIS
ncbi:uncharacterized protein [Drosophila kikkawai]|uniref:Peptidase S1 domain-containing protein n=1 Tax=Drosophila kikkawai TaxID=30033 RepID=A0A6P4IBB8_DROKI|nr:uncharacterized protein LOC108076944 [Drosophila kikkawai]